tara:strand:- start:944 stop:1192 length:249 start_codon:yes stop_codon:yes gene_type:complete
MYRAFHTIEGAKTNFDLLGDGGPIPAFLVSNSTASGQTCDMLGSHGVTFPVHIGSLDSKVVEISSKRIVSIPTGVTVTILTQ